MVKYMLNRLSETILQVLLISHLLTSESVREVEFENMTSLLKPGSDVNSLYIHFTHN